jgi:hypothetical protein
MPTNTEMREYDELVMRVASWMLRQSQANEYVPLPQLLKQFDEDVARIAHA